jgi:WD40 repeat protein
MVLVVTPSTPQSAYVRKEWNLANREGLHVVPVIGAPGIPFDQLPTWMRDFQFTDINDPDQWKRFLQTLLNPPTVPRAPFMAEELPSDYVRRTNEYESIINLLLDKKREDPVAITAALRGAGGYGKTTLARAICHDVRIRDAFRHGVLWVTLGEKPGSLVGKIEDLVYSLSNKRPGFTTLEAAVTRLVELLGERKLLIVIDDVWCPSHLKPFMQGGKNCARLITTRDYRTLPPQARQVPVHAMQLNEAVALLGAGLEIKDRAPIEVLARRLYEWPLLLRLTNRVLHERIDQHHEPLARALDFVNDALTRIGLTAFDDPAHTQADTPEMRNLAVSATIKVSLDQLQPAERTRFNELLVFPENMDIPLSALNRLWKVTGNFNDQQVELFCQRLASLSLLLRFDPVTRHIRLHDVIRDYLKRADKVDRTALHNHLLQAYAVRRWADLPTSEPYLWDWLAYHLIGAGRGQELVDTVKDFRYLVAKVRARNAYAAEADLLAAEKFSPTDVTLRLLRRHFANAGHLLKPGESQNVIGGTLHSRLQHLDALAGACHALACDLPKPFLTVRHPPPDLPRAALIRTLDDHQDSVKACAISHDGDFIVSASADGTLKLWDARTGEERRTLKGHIAEVNGCAVSPDGSFIVSASADRTLKIWSTYTSADPCTLTGHALGVNACAISPDGSVIVSASDDKTLIVWDRKTGKPRRTLEGHDGWVRACAFSPDGSFIVSASNDHTLKVWTTRTGKERLTLKGHTESVCDCVVTPDGNAIISASHDRTLKVWDAKTGKERLTLKGHKAGVHGCAISPDGSFIVSASDDRTVRIWDAKTGKERQSLSGHVRTACRCAVSPTGDFVVSASDDGTLRLWDVRAENAAAENPSLLAHHDDWASACAISANGAYLVSTAADRSLKLWSLSQLAVTWTVAGNSSLVRGCAISPDGSFIVSASDDRTLKVWDVQSQTERCTLSGHTSWVRACAVSPTGDFIVSASNDKTLKVWDAKTGAERLTLNGHIDWVNAVTIAPNGKFIVSASRDKRLMVWDAQKGTVLHTLSDHKHAVAAVAVGAQSDVIVSASNDKTLKVWDARTGMLRCTLEGHTSAVTGCAISASGDMIVSASRDRTLRVWSLKTGQCITMLHVDGPLCACAIHPDGRQIVAAGDRGLYFLRLVC